MFLRSCAFALICCFGLALFSHAAAGENREGFVPARSFNTYAVSNRHPLPPGKGVEFLAVDNMDRFNQIFVLTRVMGPEPDTVTEDLFRDNIILAVIHEGYWEMQPQYATMGQDGVRLVYSAEKQPVSFSAASPMIVAVPRGIANTFHFIENGEAAGVVTVESDNLVNLRDRYPNLNVAGGWSGYKEIDSEAKALFEKALQGLTGAGYEPLMYESQLVNGVNFRFVCKQTLTTNPPVLGIALVSFHVSFDGKVSEPDIQNVIR